MHLLQSHLLQFDVTPAGGRYCSYQLPKQDGVTSNYLATVLTPCPAYLCSLKYLDVMGSLGVKSHFLEFIFLTKSEQFQCCNEQRAFKMAITNSHNEVVIKADRPFR